MKTSEKIAKVGSEQRKASFRESPPKLIALFEEVTREFPAIRTHKMFGYPCGFVNGWMTIGLYENEFFIRLQATELTNALQMEKARFFEPIPGRPMKNYIVMPQKIVDVPIELHAWVDKAVAHALTLTPKVAKVRQKKS